MKKTIKRLLVVWVLIFALIFTVTPMNQVDADETDTSFTVTFVGKEGDVLKTIECDEAPCDIIPPENPPTIGNTRFLRWSVFEESYASINEDTEIKAIYNLDNQIIDIENVPLLGRITVQAYAFFIVSGIIVAVALALREAPRIGLTKDDFLDGFLWITPLAILGARLWYVIYEWDSFIYGNFFDSLLRIIGFSYTSADGWYFTGLSGLAIHGAFITAVILAYFYTRKRKIDAYKILDIVAVGFIIAQAFGRWGNFFNQEAHGGLVGGMTGNVANLSLQEQYEYLRHTLHIPNFIVNNMYMTSGRFIEDVGFHHPTFFYESMLNLLGFSMMLVLRRYKKIHFGEIFAFYLIWYGGVRIFIETMRTDPLTFEFLGMTLKTAIVTSAIITILGIGISVYVRLRRKDETYAKSAHTFNF